MDRGDLVPDSVVRLPLFPHVILQPKHKIDDSQTRGQYRPCNQSDSRE
jgi:hypothetical protein